MRTLLFLFALIAPAWGQTTTVGLGPGSSSRSAQRRVPKPVLWLRADEGVERNFSNLVHEWRDQSGNDFHVVQPVANARPHFTQHGLGGIPALRFDGNDTLVHPSAMPTGSYTKVVLFSLADLNRANSLVSGDVGHALLFAFSERARVTHDASLLFSDKDASVDTTTLITVTFNHYSGEGRLYQDGIQVDLDTLLPHVDPSLRLGSWGTGGFLDGSISEVQVYDQVLSQPDRQMVEQDVLARYAPNAAPDTIFQDLVQDGQIIQRNSQDLGVLNVVGSVGPSAALSIEVEVYAGRALQETVIQPLVYQSGVAPFSLSANIAAGLQDYSLEVWLVLPSERIRLVRRQNLACGDLMLICGQSNAAAKDFHSEGLANIEQSHWIRSYGTANDEPVNEPTDRHWDLAEGSTSTDHASVGQWALRLGGLLEGQLLVPVGILNGASEGTNIAANLRNDANPTDLTTIYGRLLNRAQRAGFADHARYMLWYQGEADGTAASSMDYPVRFQELEDDWLFDYPALEQIYVFQVRAGCGNDLVDDGVREALRGLAETSSVVKLMSTTAVPGHDGCHFFHVGYNEIGDRISRLILRDLHGSMDTHEIDPPNLDFAQWATVNKDMLLLHFQDLDDTLVFEAGAESDFRLDDGTGVLGATVNANTVLLTLAGPSTATTISYVGHPLDGPFLRNGRGVGALTFFQQTIQP